MNIHERVLRKKVNANDDQDLIFCLSKFEDLKIKANEINIVDKESVYSFTEMFNNYRKICAYIFEKRKNSGQELLRSTMLEGFFQFLFKDIVNFDQSIPQKTILGHANILSSFTFSPFSYKDVVQNINFATQMKDQDFVIGMNSEMVIKHGDNLISQEFTIPFVIIECKTYIEKNMLETHMNSSRETKKIFPFCLYFIAAEYMKMKTGYPERSMLDEVYILAREKNSIREKKLKENLSIDPFDPYLVNDLFKKIQNHLQTEWWDKESPFEKGKLMGK